MALFSSIFFSFHVPLSYMQHFASFLSLTSKPKPLEYRQVQPLWCSPNHRTSLISQEPISRIHTLFLIYEFISSCATAAGSVYAGSIYTTCLQTIFFEWSPPWHTIFPYFRGIGSQVSLKFQDEVDNVASRVSCQFQEDVHNIGSKASLQFKAEGDNLAPRVSWKFQSDVHNIDSNGLRFQEDVNNVESRVFGSSKQIFATQDQQISQTPRRR